MPGAGIAPELIKVVEAVPPPLAAPTRMVERSKVLAAIQTAEAAGPITAGRAREVHKAIVETGQPPPAEATAPPAEAPATDGAAHEAETRPAATEAPPAETATLPDALEARRTDTKAVLTEYANLLVDIKDTRALILAQAAAAADTPLGDQYRETMLAEIMSDPPKVARGDTKLGPLTERARGIVAGQKPFAESAFADFLKQQGFPEVADQLAKMDGKARANQMNALIAQAEGKTPGAIAQAFAAEVTGGTPMPKTATEIAAVLGGDQAARTKAVEALMRKESFDAFTTAMRDKVNSSMPSPAAAFIGVLMGIQLMTQLSGESQGSGH